MRALIDTLMCSRNVGGFGVYTFRSLGDGGVSILNPRISIYLTII